jgi:transposase-like protein
VTVAGRWRATATRAIDQFGQVIEVFVAARWDASAAHRFFQRAIGATKIPPTGVTTDQAPLYPAVLADLQPAPWHRTDRSANNRVKGDHGRLKARLPPMRGLKQDRSATVVIVGMRSSRTFDAGTPSWPLTRQRIGGAGRVRRAGHGDLSQDRGRRFRTPRSAQRNCGTARAVWRIAVRIGTGAAT